MPKEILFMLLATLLAAGSARAEDGPRRGTTFTTDKDVSRYQHRPDASTWQIYVLRGTEAKESQKDPGVTVEAKPEEKPKTRTIRRRHRTYTVPAE
jgi:hypothetical protein